MSTLGRLKEHLILIPTVFELALTVHRDEFIAGVAADTLDGFEELIRLLNRTAAEGDSSF